MNYWIKQSKQSESKITSVYCSDHVPWNATSLEAAKIIGEIWCDSPTDRVDTWGCDWTSREFIKEFLNICKERGKALKALEIGWGAHNCPGGEYDWCTNDMIDQSIIEWVTSQISIFCFDHGEGHEIMVKAYRKMFQSFVESIKEQNDSSKDT